MKSSSGSRRNPQGLLRAGLLAILTVGSSAAPGALGASSRPNIIVILADDLGYADTGVYGCEDFGTPHIDSLARNGIRFTNAYVSAPYCSPSRAGLLTGRYQQRFGHEFNPHSTPHFLAQGGDPRKAGLPFSETTLADRLEASGYVTGIVGKWHLGSKDERFHPQRRGFQEFFGFLGGGHDYFKSEALETAPEHLWIEPGDTREYRVWIQRNGLPVEHPGYLTDGFSREAESFIRRHAAEVLPLLTGAKVVSQEFRQECTCSPSRKNACTFSGDQRIESGLQVRTHLRLRLAHLLTNLSLN